MHHSIKKVCNLWPISCFTQLFFIGNSFEKLAPKNCMGSRTGVDQQHRLEAALQESMRGQYSLHAAKSWASDGPRIIGQPCLASCLCLSAQKEIEAEEVVWPLHKNYGQIRQCQLLPKDLPLLVSSSYIPPTCPLPELLYVLLMTSMAAWGQVFNCSCSIAFCVQ